MSSQLIAASSSQRDGPGVRTRTYARTPSSSAVSRPAGEAAFVLMDSQGKVIHANKQACRILTYPQEIGNDLSGRASILAQLNSMFSPETDFPPTISSVAEFFSGKRKYNCRAFCLTKTSGVQPSGASVAFVLEREGIPPHILEKVSNQFHLTRREQQVVEFSIQGLTNKEIASRMSISANTVRAFIRMIMVKLGVSTRSGIVGVVFRAIYSPTSSISA